MNDPTNEELLRSIEAKSDQLNADELVAGPITVTIAKVSRGDKEQPIVVELEGHRPYKPCKTCRRILIAAFSDDPKEWIGKRMTLYRDPDVVWAGVKVGGIRVSHLSGIKEPRVFCLSQSRGKKAEYTIYPLPDITDAERAYIEECRGEIARAETLETLRAIGFIVAKKSAAIRDALRAEYEAKKMTIKGGSHDATERS